MEKCSSDSELKNLTQKDKKNIYNQFKKFMKEFEKECKKQEELEKEKEEQQIIFKEVDNPNERKRVIHNLLGFVFEDWDENKVFEEQLIGYDEEIYSVMKVRHPKDVEEFKKDMEIMVMLRKKWNYFDED
tara:strand:+ start:3694 stop:4083 length:390 start_codon:yes stop_codon:yes gene_type:complete